MSFSLSKEQKAEVIGFIRRFFSEKLEVELTEVQAGFLLDYFRQKSHLLLTNRIVKLERRHRSNQEVQACHNFVLPESAADSVNSSADSRPPPAGMPRAMRVSVIGLPFKRSTM